ncbi:MAG: alpha/beta fold hydrolase [Deltaproteobacteria bacterium]|nr:alpha/beta fold hydrolase [Deltaproteobacteria bacterium]
MRDRSRPPRPARRLLRVADRAVLGLANGLVQFVDGAARPTMGNAPKELVLKKGKLEVHRLVPPAAQEVEIGTETLRVEARRFPVPVLLVPPLMVRPYIYDLRPDHSLARMLRNRGFAVHIVDFGVPEREDAGLRLEDYVLDFMPAAVEATRKSAGSKDVSLVGYCMGGIFALLYAAALGNDGVRSIVSIGAPVNFEKMGLLTIAARLGAGRIDALMDRIGNIPGGAASQGFKLMSGAKAITKWADLFIHLWDEEYVRGFDAVNTWVNELIPYPRDAFRQMVKDVVAGNKLLGRDLVLGGRKIDVGAVEVPLLAFAGRTDNIAPIASAADIVEIVGSRDKRFIEVPGGHVGVVAGRKARQAVWEPTADWLAPRSL